jgi:hypothetical protein
MKNKFYLLLCLIFISGCGGGGGAAAFALLLADLGSTSTNEDTAYNSNLSASTNYNSDITYSISSSPANGQAAVSSSGAISYMPNQDYNGQDTFVIRVSATRIDSGGQSSGTPITKTQSVTMTINPINDAPVLTLLDDFSGYGDTSIIFDDLLNMNISVSDVDNDNSELQFYGSMPTENISGVYGDGTTSSYVTLDFSGLNTAGLLTMSLCVSDGSIETCASDQIQAYYVANKEVKNVEYDCDTDGLNCSESDQHLYYLVGSPNSSAKTNYIFIGDQLTGTADRDEFRLRLAESVNLLVASDAADVVNGYFNIIVLEEVALTGVSVFDIAIGCYSDWDPNIYCIGEVDRNLITNIMPSWTVASFLTTISGRGVAQGSVNIQGLSSRTREVVMHELGHSHGFMGDEYDSGGERTFPDYYADFPMNTTTVKDPELAKWSHHIDDFNNVPGVNYDVCYNYADGSIYYRDELTYEECECYMNQYPDSEEYPGTNEDDSCKTKIGLLEGTYYGEIETYRPRWISVMWCCFLEYGKVNIEGFAVGSIMNQGFSNHKINSEEDPSYVLNNPSGLGETITFEIDAVYDETKLKLTWLVDGQEQTELENNLTATFNRPSDNRAVSYSWVVEDLTGALIAPNDPNNPLDFYESYWERAYYYQSDPALTPLASLNPYVGSWSWYKDGGYSKDDTVDSSNEDQFLYGELCCSMGASYKINWFNYQNSSTSQLNDDSNSKSQTVIRRTPTTDKISKIFSLNLSSNNIEIKEINNDYPLKRDIKRPFINKSDIYALNFLNADKELIYQIGINDPFKAGAQHIGYEDYKEYQFDVPINNFKVVVPQEVEASYIELVRRTHNNELIIMDISNI